jgi:hypothetical protein
MTIDLPAARSFLATHGRILDRRRLDILLGGGDADGVVAALEAHRNPDGGFGWGLEPDLRDAGSQPTAGMHAFEVLAEVAPTDRTTGIALALCDWLSACTRPDGGLPFALPIDDPAGCAPWWLGADPTTSALQMTTQVAATAHLVARRDPAVAAHPWLATATGWCVDAIRRMEATPTAYELLFAVQFVNAWAGPGADDLLDRLGAHVPADGVVPVAGGAEGEALRPLDLAPLPTSPARRLVAAEVIESDLDRLAGAQQADGGWTVDFPSSSPAGALEWRGYVTVEAVAVLRGNGRI